MSDRLFVAFLWHMHQPWYSDPRSGQIVLPWVRLHAAKDYVDMASILDDFPQIHQTFNLTPCLMEQLHAYEQMPDAWQELASIRTEDLTEAQRNALAHQCTFAHPEHMADPYPHYYELIARTQRRQTLTAQELRDLTVWFNWVWIDPMWRSREPMLMEIQKKGRGFTEEEKQAVLSKQLELVRAVIPTYRRLQEQGRIEVSTTPYTHPILPLLFNTDSALEAAAHSTLPRHAFSYPEDIAEHLQRAVSIYQKQFGRLPQGLWPSEGSVSQAIVPEVARAGFHWMATDEEILWRSLEGQHSRRALFYPYHLKADGQTMRFIFRDRGLSDLIGFQYSTRPAVEAVDDLVKHLQQIRADSHGSAPLVSIILDGENAWEHYPNDGRDFLLALYERLSRQSNLNCVTISEYFAAHPVEHSLKRLATGSWIRGDFSTWIGVDEKNRAWEHLSQARQAYAQAPDSPNKKEAYQHLLLAEGSDWFWWFGPEHSSAHDEEFDRLFRERLIQVYTTLQLPVPDDLREPINRGGPSAVVPPVHWITPKIDGQVTDYFEWLSAGQIDCRLARGAMTAGKQYLAKLGWGCDAHHWYLRLDWEAPLEGPDVKLFFKGEKPKFQLEISREGPGRCILGNQSLPVEAAWQHIVELKVPLNVLDLKPGQEISGQVEVRQGGAVVELFPPHGNITLKLPEESDGQEWWSA